MVVCLYHDIYTKKHQYLGNSFNRKFARPKHRSDRSDITQKYPLDIKGYLKQYVIIDYGIKVHVPLISINIGVNNSLK